MVYTNEQPFRFMDLPSELRNKIYSLLLCSKCRPKRRLTGDTILRGCSSPLQSINPTILRTSSQVHQEAYDVMVKTNRFVHVRSTNDVALDSVLQLTSVPYIITNEVRASRFTGYVLRVTLSTECEAPYRTKPGRQSAAMVLAQDLDLLCSCIATLNNACKGNSTALHIDIVVAPALSTKRLRYKPSLDTFFTENIQESLMLPFRRVLRGITRISVSGHVLPKLVEAVYLDTAENEWTDPDKALKDVINIKEEGVSKWKAGKVEAAYFTWIKGILVLHRIRGGSSWGPLTICGGESFIDKVAELWFTILLNMIQAGLKLIGHLLSGPCAKENHNMLDTPMEEAHEIIQWGFWKKNHIWRPSNIHLAKLRYRQAQILRLTGGVLWVEALVLIAEAIELVPGDSVLLKEQDAIYAWMMQSLH